LPSLSVAVALALLESSSPSSLLLVLDSPPFLQFSRHVWLLLDVEHVLGPLEVQQQVWLGEPLEELLEDQIEYNKDLFGTISIYTTYSLVYRMQFQKFALDGM
jgi:hypothetical protein